MSPQMGGVRWYGEIASARAHAGARHGLYLWAEHVLEQATRIVPLAPDGGTLMRSGHAWQPGENGLDQTHAAVTYDTPYACRQHEELDWHHAPGRQAKYLEDPLNASQATGDALVGREVKAALGG